MYYLHPNNQSADGHTSLCQPIGEAITLFSELLLKLTANIGQVAGEIYADADADIVFAEITPAADWRDKKVLGASVFSYRALARGHEITVAAYSRTGAFLRGDIRDLTLLYKLLPCFTVLLAQEVLRDKSIESLSLRYIDKTAVDVFANLHEDFYQNHKFDEYALRYEDLADFDVSDLSAYSVSYSVVKENLEAMQKTQAAVIRTFPASDFTKEERALIPKPGEEFALPQTFGGVCNAIAAGDALSMLLHGPAGTGKTMACKLLCQAVALPIIDIVNCTENLDEYILGKYLPQGDRIVFRESCVTQAIRSGGAVVFEEINFAKPQYISFLNSLLDDNGFVRLDSGEIVRRHPHFRFFATMNIGYYGTKELNQALYNRFNIIFEMTELSDEDIRRMLLIRVPECEAFADKMIGVYHKLRQKIKSEELDLVISPRNLENWARLAKYEGYVKASQKTLLPIAKGDDAFEEAIRGIILLHKWT
jgi:MoxR-like ATPase